MINNCGANVFISLFPIFRNDRGLKNTLNKYHCSWTGLIVPAHSTRVDSRSLTSRKRHEEGGFPDPHENRFPEPPSWSSPTTVSCPASQSARIDRNAASRGHRRASTIRQLSPDGPHQQRAEHKTCGNKLKAHAIVVGRYVEPSHRIG